MSDEATLQAIHWQPRRPLQVDSYATGLQMASARIGGSGELDIEVTNGSDTWRTSVMLPWIARTLPQSPPLAVGPRADEDRGSNEAPLDHLIRALHDQAEHRATAMRYSTPKVTLEWQAADRLDALQAVVDGMKKK